MTKPGDPLQKRRVLRVLTGRTQPKKGRSLSLPREKVCRCHQWRVSADNEEKGNAGEKKRPLQRPGPHLLPKKRENCIENLVGGKKGEEEKGEPDRSEYSSNGKVFRSLRKSPAGPLTAFGKKRD